VVDPINSLSPMDPLKGVQAGGAAKTGPTDGKTFNEYLQQKLAEVNDLQMAAEDAKTKLTTGQTDDIASVVLAARKADVAFKALMEIRNKLTDAYEQILQSRG
jgi:flagellar hook-basal body complex protein FliE